MSQLGKPAVTWEMIAEHWPLVAADLMSEYQVNVYDQRQLRRLTWPAGSAMIGGLFSADTRIARWYDAEYGQQPKKGAGRGAGHR